MWISRKEYNHLVSSKEFWEKEYDNICTNRMALLTELSDRLDLMDSIQSENSILREQAEEYKQKYADEVQKRLELIKLLENTPLDK